MMQARQFFIGGEWVEPAGGTVAAMVSPTDGTPVGDAVLGTPVDIARAVDAAAAAFPAWSASSVTERLAVLARMRAAFAAIADPLAEHLIHETGLTLAMAKGQSMLSLAHFDYNMDILREYAFVTRPDPMVELVREAIGVVGAITSWNAPVSQMLCKAVPAMAAGCTVVVKPSERAPLCAHMLAEAMAKAEIPPGVFNLVNGAGDCGAAMAGHPQVAMVSFTGSIAGGAAVAASAAPTIARVHQELGGKSANILLENCDFAALVPRAVSACMMNSGQVCAAPTRLLVPAGQMGAVIALAKAAAEAIVVGHPADPATQMGPLANAMQFDRVSAMIAEAVAAGQPLVTGGADIPPGLEAGLYLRPTIFAPVNPAARIAREEVFGPVLVIIPFADDSDAVRIANDSDYGLAAYVEGGDFARARAVARQLRAGYVRINSPGWTNNAPFGGYKRSGNGRQYGVWGFEEFLETKALVSDPRED